MIRGYIAFYNYCEKIKIIKNYVDELNGKFNCDKLELFSLYLTGEI